MEMIYVESSNLSAIGFENNTLVIEFKDGSAYEYYDVPDYVFDELMNADSKGSYAHRNIYKVYSQSRIR